MNEKALAEMNMAMNQMLQALEKCQEMQKLLNDSYSHFQESSATSVNRNAACYQQIQQTVEQAYQGLFKAAENLNQQFSHPTIQRMIQSAKVQQ
ncbi:hypothetical protein PCC9214_05377 (plasmid) [Planktothrix tepida]|uniref:Uncharacterized protein n=1 Tax=Planktothrix tepida PCC 9214 TaxID=671072 RepID=A0A1J1LN57_9CYAN|nr:hypothetical protein [Planktothrix tepida]CAD5988415.1 hypothetical protein PCC9214_05377 [Planktothrix tepida]CUR33923.1 hypothetical protein PL921460032 [Planktothrix tepida PCC 9214]